MITPMEIRYEKMGQRVVKALQARFFEAWYFANETEAVEKIMSLIP